MHRLALPAAAAIMASPIVGHARTLDFAGHTWDVRDRYGGPGPNRFDDGPRSVWVDDFGHLHLTIRQIDGRWHGTEVSLPTSLGYGEYRWQVSSEVQRLDRNAVLGLFTYENDTREIDIEFARWGDPRKPAGHYSVQPAYELGNSASYDPGLHGDASTHRFTWAEDRIDFASHYGRHSDTPPDRELINEWAYEGNDIPPVGGERAYMNFWLFQGREPSDGRPMEVVISDFEFTPESELNVVPAPGTVSLTLAGGVALLGRRPSRSMRTPNG